jgi:hypothetical protein
VTDDEEHGRASKVYTFPIDHAGAAGKVESGVRLFESPVALSEAQTRLRECLTRGRLICGSTCRQAAHEETDAFNAGILHIDETIGCWCRTADRP